MDPKRSPVVLLVLPQVRRGILWTAGEVQFLAERMTSSFPGLQKVLTCFREWLRSFPVVFRQPQLPETSGGSWDYYLEGGLRNVSDEICALPTGITRVASSTCGRMKSKFLSVKSKFLSVISSISISYSYGRHSLGLKDRALPCG